jgi:hypothetical protein
VERGHARSRLSAREPCRSPRMPRAPSSPEWTWGRRKVVREGAGQAAVTGEGAGWRVRRRRLPGPRSPPGPEPAVRTLPGRGSRASRGRARRAAAGKEVGAAPRDARASFMNAPCRVGCQGTGRPTGIPGTVKTWPRGARAGRCTRGPLLSRGILAMSCLPELARLAFSWITRAFAVGRSSWRPPRSSAPRGERRGDGKGSARRACRPRRQPGAPGGGAPSERCQT